MRPASYRKDEDAPRKRNCIDQDGRLVEDDGFITLYPPMRDTDGAGQSKTTGH